MFAYSKLDIKRVSGPSEIPAEPHWAILIFETRSESMRKHWKGELRGESIYVEGDERSCTCPGHGYPAHTEVYPTYEYWVIKSEDVLKKALVELEEANKKTYSKPGPYVVLSVRKCAVKTEIRVEVG